MSFAQIASLAGGALRDLEDRKYLTDKRAADLASSAKSAQVQDIQIRAAQQAETDAGVERSRKTAYEDILKTTGNDRPAYLKAASARAQELGDTKAFAQFTTEYAGELQKQFADKMNRGLRHFMVSGDPSVLEDNFNSTSSGMKIKIEPGGAPGKYMMTSLTPDGKQTQPQEVGRDEIGRMTMMAMDPKFAETIFKEQAKNALEISKEQEKGKIKLEHDKQLEGYKGDRMERIEGVKHKYTVAELAAKAIEDRKTGASNAAAHGAQTRMNTTWKAATDFATAGEGGLDTKEQDKRVQMGLNALQKALGEDEFGRLKQTNQPLYLKAIKAIGERVRSGINPETAASEVTLGMLKENAIGEAAKKISPPGGAAGLPLKPTVTMPPF